MVEDTPSGTMPRCMLFWIAVLLGFAGGFFWVAF